MISTISPKTMHAYYRWQIAGLIKRGRLKRASIIADLLLDDVYPGRWPARS